MDIQEKIYTLNEYLDVIQQPENADKRLELISGRIQEKGAAEDIAPSSRLNSIIAARITHFLNMYVIANDFGYVTGADGGFDPGNEQVRIPDTAFVAKSRVNDLSGILFSGAPDLAVEVISPGETSRKVIEKLRAYLDAGARVVWTVYPVDRVVDVYTLNADDSLNLRTVGVDDTLDGGDILPGFSLRVQDIFPG